jgi:hypothetical protein
MLLLLRVCETQTWATAAYMFVGTQTWATQTWATQTWATQTWATQTWAMGDTNMGFAIGIAAAPRSWRSREEYSG